MTSRTVKISALQADGSQAEKSTTVWSTRWGPVVVIPPAGLNWTTARAYALKDVIAGNARSLDMFLAQDRADSVAALRDVHMKLGAQWSNTVGADRHGEVLYTDGSTVPDVDAAQLERCAPSAPAKALFRAAGLVVLDGSKSACDWRQDPASARPGAIPYERMPKAIRGDWVENSNDSFYFTHPAQRFGDISPLVGEAIVTRPRTRAGLTEIPELLARGKVTPEAVLAQLFENRNFMGSITMPDLLAACTANPPASAEAKDGCAALRGWNRTNTLDARGAHLFREFWRTARLIPGVYRIPFDAAQPVATPAA